MECGGVKVETEGIEPSFQRCERRVLPLDDVPESRASSRGGIRTRNGPFLRRLSLPLDYP